MRNRKNHLTISYGAFELKATYQRNLLLGTLIVTFLVLTSVAVGFVLQQETPTVIVPDNPTLTPPIIASLTETKFDRPKSQVPAGPRRPHSDARYVIPNPVAEEEFDPTESEGVIASKDERIDIIDGAGLTPGDGGGSGSQSGEGDYDALEPRPKRGVFIPVEKQPEMIYSVKPEYPRLLEKAGIGGKVYIQALISRTGAVMDAVVYVSSGHALLDEAALAVAGKYKYRPAIQNGTPVAVWISYYVNFEPE